MRDIWNWAIKNLSHIFSLIGIGLTIYLGVSAPSWWEDIKQERFLDARNDLQQSIKELVYSDSTCTIEEIVVLMEAKQLQLSQSYPYTVKEILTQVQDSFMQDRFLPLEDRRRLVNELKELKAAISPSTGPDKIYVRSHYIRWYDIIPILSVVLPITLAFIGIRSIYLKRRAEKEKDQEIANIENQVAEPARRSPYNEAQNYEKQIIEIIRDHPNVKDLQQANPHDLFDAKFTYNNKQFFLEVKYLTRTSVGLASFNQFLNYSHGLEGYFWFVYNTDLTAMVKRRAAEENHWTKNKRLTLIKATTPEEFKLMLPKLLSDH